MERRHHEQLQRRSHQNGIFNKTTQQPRTCDELTQMYQNGEVFTNPAYSRGNQQSVQSNIDVILQRISETIVDTTGFMPVTRERLILETWGELVKKGFPQQDLPPIQVPCDL